MVARMVDDKDHENIEVNNKLIYELIGLQVDETHSQPTNRYWLSLSIRRN
jgi:hypothetical protein